MNTNSAPTIDLNSLLEAAKNAPASERPRALQTLATFLATHDPFTVATIAEQVKAFGLCNKGDFMDAIRSAKTQLQTATGLSVKPTDDELAERWLAKHPHTAYGLGEFRRYKDGIWPELPLDDVKKEILEEIELAKDTGIKPTSRLLESVLEIARVKVSVPNVRWDNQVDFLPCQNGVLALSNRALLPHSPDWYFTTKLNYDYDPQADCPNFKRVLNEAIPDAAGFLEEFAGYALTPDTSHEIAVWLYGPPGSGRSSLLIGLQAMLGSRADVLGLRAIEQSQFGLTNLIGKTLMLSMEQPSTYLTATDTLNAIISGEAIVVNRKFRDPISIIPRAKLAWAMNELPRVKDPGNGLFRRIKVIQFPPLDESKKDPKVKEAIKTEGAGILNCALDGLDRLKRRGRFEVPTCVRAATDDFKLANDVPGMFVADKCILGPDSKTQAQLLYEAYRTWCLDNGHQPQSATSLADDWRRFGFERRETDGRRWWYGVGLRAK